MRWKSISILAAGLLLVAAFALIATARAKVNAPIVNVAVGRLIRASDADGTHNVENIQEYIRPDGSRNISMLRTFRSKTSPTGWETVEVRTIYRAVDNTTFNIFPALKRFGSLPVGKQKYHPIAAVDDCVPTDHPDVSRGSDTARFGRRVQNFVQTITDQGSPRKMVITQEAFPSLGCLEGNKMVEMWDTSLNTLLAVRTSDVVSLTEAPDEPSRFAGPPASFSAAKPSEILQQDAATKGRACPECEIAAGHAADVRHDRLWKDRVSGKR